MTSPQGAARQEQTAMGVTRDRALAISLQLDQLRLMCLDAVAICEAAARYVDNEEWKREIMRLRDDHMQRVSEITNVIHELGGEAITTDCPSALAAYLIGKIQERPGDVAHVILKLKLHEELLLRHFQDLTDMYAPAPVISMLSHAADAQEQHAGWATHVLEQARASSAPAT